jgi:very-short-patch-repair endonuclease
LCVECDGPFHDRIKDAERDRYLATMDIAVVRLPWQECYDQALTVEQQISRVVEWRTNRYKK